MFNKKNMQQVSLLKFIMLGCANFVVFGVFGAFCKGCRLQARLSDFAFRAVTSPWARWMESFTRLSSLTVKIKGKWHIKLANQVPPQTFALSNKWSVCNSIFQFALWADLLQLNRTIGSEVRVRVKDENDNYPVFRKGFDFAEIIWQSQQLIYRFDADDTDAGQNAEIVFALNSEDRKFFHVRGRHLFTTGRKPPNNTYTLEVTAKDLGKGKDLVARIQG